MPTAVNKARIGVFGGTFDPPHAGHIAAAACARHELRLERVLLVPANIPWQKAGSRMVSTASDRVAMLSAAAAGIDGIEVSSVEIERGGESYTIDTVDQMAPRGEVWVIIGSDVAPQLDTWRRAGELRERARFAVYDRAGREGDRPPEGFRYECFEVPRLDLSSTEVRARVGRGQPIDGLVCREVAAYIRSRGLYR